MAKKRKRNPFRFKSIDPRNAGRAVTKVTGKKIKRLRITRVI